MGLENRVYSVLVVSSSSSFNNGTKELLSTTKYCPIYFSDNISEAKRRVAEQAYDFIIINSPVPDGTGIRFAIDCCRSQQSIVLLMVRNDIYSEVHEQVVNYGVFTLRRPVTKTIMNQALCWMSSARERLRCMEQKTISVEERMHEIRIINRAKCLLISELHMTEPQAHRYIEKQAMDTCVSKRVIAEGIIKTYS